MNVPHEKTCPQVEFAAKAQDALLHCDMSLSATCQTIISPGKAAKPDVDATITVQKLHLFNYSPFSFFHCVYFVQLVFFLCGLCL